MYHPTPVEQVHDQQLLPQERVSENKFPFLASGVKKGPRFVLTFVPFGDPSGGSRGDSGVTSWP